jgi:hypothetical protein
LAGDQQIVEMIDPATTLQREDLYDCDVHRAELVAMAGGPTSGSIGISGMRRTLPSSCRSSYHHTFPVTVLASPKNSQSPRWSA